MLTTLSHEIKVGIFTLIGIILFCLSVILLGGDRFVFSRAYLLKVRMPQVQGLGRGSVISLSGVSVGNIEDIDFVRDSNQVEVTFTVRQSVKNKITEGSVASVKTQGALGDKYIYITPGPADAKPLPPGSILPMDTTPDLLDMIASKGAELGEVVEVIKEVHKLFENLNQDGRSAKLMSNLVNDSDEMQKFLAEGRETFRFMRTDTLVPLSHVMKKLDDGQGTLGALINDRSLHNRLTRLLGAPPRSKFLKPLIRDSIETHEDAK